MLSKVILHYLFSLIPHTQSLFSYMLMILLSQDSLYRKFRILYPNSVLVSLSRILAPFITFSMYKSSVFPMAVCTCLNTNISMNSLRVVLLSVNPIMHSRTKHFKLDLHFIWDYVQQNKICLLHLLARFQVADTFTKPIICPSFLDFCRKLMVVEPPL